VHAAAGLLACPRLAPCTVLAVQVLGSDELSVGVRPSSAPSVVKVDFETHPLNSNADTRLSFEVRRAGLRWPPLTMLLAQQISPIVTVLTGGLVKSLSDYFRVEVPAQRAARKSAPGLALSRVRAQHSLSNLASVGDSWMQMQRSAFLDSLTSYRDMDLDLRCVRAQRAGTQTVLTHRSRARTRPPSGWRDSPSCVPGRTVPRWWLPRPWALWSSARSRWAARLKSWPTVPTPLLRQDL
jgi:hypothetical protein